MYTSLVLLYEGSNNERGAESECLKPVLSIHSQRRQWQPTPVLLPGKSHGWRSLQSMGSRRVRHDWATSLWLFTFLHWRRKWRPTPVLATHSSVLAWRIPGTEEPNGPPSMGLHRVGHDWSDLATAVSTPKQLLFDFAQQWGSGIKEGYIHSLTYPKRNIQ